MPRKSAADLAFNPVHPLPSRLKPPGTLSELARAEFLRIVANESPTHFKNSDLSLLVRYCEGAALAERAEVHIRTEDPPSARWLAAWREGTKVMKDLALRLRLSPQSRQPNTPKRPERPLSYYERMALEDDDANAS